MFGFYAAITRQDRSGSPPGGWMPDQRMSRAEALKALTLDAAYAAHAETLLGSLEPGKLADLVILSADIMRVPAGGDSHHHGADDDHRRRVRSLTFKVETSCLRSQNDDPARPGTAEVLPARVAAGAGGVSRRISAAAISSTTRCSTGSAMTASRCPGASCCGARFTSPTVAFRTFTSPATCSTAGWGSPRWASRPPRVPPALKSPSKASRIRRPCATSCTSGCAARVMTWPPPTGEAAGGEALRLLMEIRDELRRLRIVERPAPEGRKTEDAG